MGDEIKMPTHSHADGISTDTIGVCVRLSAAIGLSNGGRGSPCLTSALRYSPPLLTLNEKPNMASRTTCDDPRAFSNSSAGTL